MSATLREVSTNQAKNETSAKEDLEGLWNFHEALEKVVRMQRFSRGGKERVAPRS